MEIILRFVFSIIGLLMFVGGGIAVGSIASDASGWDYFWPIAITAVGVILVLIANSGAGRIYGDNEDPLV